MKNLEITSNQYPDITDFAKSLPLELKKEVYKVVMALLDESNLTGSNVIKIPFHRLNKNNFSDEDSIAILKNLQRKDIASTLLTIIEHKGNKEKPSIGLCKSIIEDDNVFNGRAQIYIKKDRLNYLEQQLKKWMVDENISTDLSKIKSITVVKENNRNKRRVIINKNYIGSFEILNSTSKYIRSLVNAIIDKTDVLNDIANPTDCKDYLNSNSNCRLYRSTDGKKQIYTITPLVEFKNSYVPKKELGILPKIKTDTITYTRYSKLLSGQKSQNKIQRI